MNIPTDLLTNCYLIQHIFHKMDKAELQSWAVSEWFSLKTITPMLLTRVQSMTIEGCITHCAAGIGMYMLLNNLQWHCKLFTCSMLPLSYHMPNGSPMNADFNIILVENSNSGCTILQITRHCTHQSDMFIKEVLQPCRQDLMETFSVSDTVF